MTELITNDHQVKELIQLSKTVAQSKATILIQGESGTGKELIAQLIHENSNRSSKPFVAINCAAIPENLLESELFGYERGSFTGAIASKAGKFELAHFGTLLLDEISEMDIRLQSKLLRVLQESEVDKIGGKKPIFIDTRIVATTNLDLSQLVKNGKFRQDLFFRLNVVNLTLPPLRNRIGDVKILSNYFLKKFSEKNLKEQIVGLSAEAMSLLESHFWPGNVRELKNTIERAVITTKNSILLASDIQIQNNKNSFSKMQINWKPGNTLDDIERNVILDALHFHQGNRTHTANSLGISIRTLRNKIADYRKMGLEV